MNSTISSANTLKLSWEQLKNHEPKLRIRDAAKKLGVSEAELLGTGLGENVIRLSTDFAEQVQKFPNLGRVMALTRNEGCVLEHKGTFQKINLHGSIPNQIATVIGPIEQRVFFRSWKFGFAVLNDTPQGPRFSLQYFDKSGEAVMKVFLQEDSDFDFSEKLVEAHRHSDQISALETEPFEAVDYSSREDLDFKSFQSDWENMQDTHDFFGMLRKYNLNRLNAVEWIDDRWAYEVDRLSTRKILASASATQLPIMIFAGNKGNIQIHQGKVKTIRQMGDWLNVMDPEFNMHLNEAEVDRAFVVHKNTSEGLVSSLELFDLNGEMVAQFFGLRKPGIPQKTEWKDLLDSLN
ncbi:hemin-degrading factor [Algoriphagus hitonicola]|uniref:Putative hemin transport protein n=1 Tax=Algoriphagus hitonicola TaxID=435880 RepID=A0A1I2U3V5_9BACT|nr:ChuX/HutX family heme-like substrate-binding protein [Algoriphagus hitonicola]SFG71845.1 putative hemin transport protein [Algoriphagus hitonicola]